jgi:hypothetical protein
MAVVEYDKQGHLVTITSMRRSHSVKTWAVGHLPPPTEAAPHFHPHSSVVNLTRCLLGSCSARVLQTTSRTRGRS